MKRFIDLTGQLTLEDHDRAFAWFDTVTDRFETHGDLQTWETWSEFERDYEGSDLERYRRLALPWVYGETAVTVDQAYCIRCSEAKGHTVYHETGLVLDGKTCPMEVETDCPECAFELGTGEAVPEGIVHHCDPLAVRAKEDA